MNLEVDASDIRTELFIKEESTIRRYLLEAVVAVITKSIDNNKEDIMKHLRKYHEDEVEPLGIA
jgi:hypothetical protein